jgi:hypothetical protein
MAITLPNVQKGDLITADAWNTIIKQLQDLDTRLSRLEVTSPGGEGQFTITGLSATTVNVGDPLTIFGVNFGLISRNVVTFTANGVTTTVPASTYDPLSNDTKLTFPVPGITGLGATGSVRMTVTNPNGSDFRDLTVNVVVTVPTGNIEVRAIDFKNLGATPSNVVDSPGSFLLSYSLRAATTRSDKYDLSFPNLTPAGATAQYVNDNLAPIVPPQVTLAPGGEGVGVKVLLTLPSGLPKDTPGSISVKVTSQLNPTGVSQSPSVTTFQALDPLPAFGTLGITTTGGIGGIKNGTIDAQGVLQIAAGTECTLTLSTGAAGAQSGDYRVSATSFDGASGGWTGRWASPGSNTFAWDPASGAKSFKVAVVANGASPSTVVWRIRFERMLNGTPTTPFGELPITVHVQ